MILLHILLCATLSSQKGDYRSANSAENGGVIENRWALGRTLTGRRHSAEGGATKLRRTSWVARGIWWEGHKPGGSGGRDAAWGARRLKKLKVMRQFVRTVAEGVGAAGCRGRAMCTL